MTFRKGNQGRQNRNNRNREWVDYEYDVSKEHWVKRFVLLEIRSVFSRSSLVHLTKILTIINFGTQ